MLGVFAKLPHASPVKTRLQARLPRAAAEGFCLAALADTLETACRVVPRPVLFLAPEEAAGESVTAATPPAPAMARAREALLAAGLEPAAWAALQVRFQVGADLGERLENAFAFLCTGGPALVIGADSPSLGPAMLHDAFRRLRDADVVLGPAADGGYWAIGLGRAEPGLLRGIAWSTARTLLETETRAVARSLRVGRLMTWSDVDEPDDLPVLARQIAERRAAGDTTTARHSEVVLRSLNIAGDARWNAPRDSGLT